MNRKVCEFVLIGLMLICSGCSQASKPAATESSEESFVLPVGYVPNVQFAPLYAAIEKGYFKEEGLNITLDHNQETDTVALVGAGKLPFGICSGEQVLLGRNQGLPLVYIAAWYRRYPVGIVSLKEKNFSKMEDLRGATVGIPVLSGTSYIGLEAMLQTAGMKDQDIQLKAVGYSQVELLTTGKIDAAVVYTTNEPEQLKSLGYEINLIPASDLVSMVGNGLITNEQIMKEKPQLAERMTRAFVRGLTWTENHPDEAFEICKKYVTGLDQTKDQTLQKNVLNQTIKLYQSDRNLAPGMSDSEAWANMAKVLINMGQLPEGFDAAGVFTNDLVEKAEK